MGLTSLIQQTNIAHASVLEAIEGGSDEETDTLSPLYESRVKTVLSYKPRTLEELEQKTRFIFDSLLGDYDDSIQTQAYLEVILADITRLKSKTR